MRRIAKQLPTVPSMMWGDKFEMRPHQLQALNAWKASAFQGILAHATGSGKTITAVYGAVRLFDATRRLALVVSVPYQNLADQWVNVLSQFHISAIRAYGSRGVWFERLSEQLTLFQAGATPFLCVVVVNRTLQSEEFQKLLLKIPGDQLMWVGDECHHHAGRSLASSLPQNAQMRLASVNACAPRLLYPGLHQDEVPAAVRAIAAEQDASRICQQYLETIGHIPLNADLGLVGALKVREIDGRRDLTPLFNWAQRSNSPFAHFHACQFALSAATELTPEQDNIVATWFWEAVCSQNVVENANDGHVAWRLAMQLAQYYVHYLELRLPSDRGEAIAAMAWWMSMRLLTALGGGVERMRHFGKQLDRVYGSITSEIWDLVNPPMAPSAFRWMTLFGPSPWALFLLSAVQTEDQMHALLKGAGPGSAEERLNALNIIAVQVGHLPLQEVGYGLSDDARRPLAWIAAREADESRKAALQLWAEGVDWTPPDSLAKALEMLNHRDNSLQQWLCHGIRQRMSAGVLNGDELWAKVSTADWKKSKWLALDLLSVQALGCALIEDAARRGPEWWPQVPHLFTEIAEERSSTDSDRQAMFGLLLRACCALKAPSAMARLLRGRSGHRFRALATTVRGNLEQALPQAGGWGAGRLRSLMVELLG